MSGMLVGMRALSTKAGGLVNRLSERLFPPACLFCKSPMAKAGCCQSCLEQIHIWPHAVCRRCGAELPESMQPGPCGHCLNKPPAQAHTYNLYQYSGPVRDAILEWKLQGHDAAVRWLVDEAMPSIRARLASGALLLPVPMPLSRMRTSGQHHAANLCRWLAEGADCNWEWRLLRRTGEQPRQSALSGQARRHNLCKAFVLSDDSKQRLQNFQSQPSSIWIVDDILTTGSTLHYAAKACLKLGLDVNVLSLARTSHRG